MPYLGEGRNWNADVQRYDEFWDGSQWRSSYEVWNIQLPPEDAAKSNVVIRMMKDK